jgi:hypothetical protein
LIVRKETDLEMLTDLCFQPPSIPESGYGSPSLHLYACAPHWNLNGWTDFINIRLPPSCWFPAWTILRPGRWRQHVSPKRYLIFNGLHGVISQNIKLFSTSRFGKLRKVIIAYFPLIRHRPHRKRSFQQFFYCCVRTCCRGNVFT